VFPTASSVPYFAAIERGFFREQGIEPETIRLIGGPPNIAAMISNQIEAAIVLVTIEGMNANLKKPEREAAAVRDCAHSARQGAAQS
jgi:NitT/TauT family transport system substrate-binding protein